jgi:hypothetical protein
MKILIYVGYKINWSAQEEKRNKNEKPTLSSPKLTQLHTSFSQAGHHLHDHRLHFPQIPLTLGLGFLNSQGWPWCGVGWAVAQGPKNCGPHLKFISSHQVVNDNRIPCEHAGIDGHVINRIWPNSFAISSHQCSCNPMQYQ